MIKTSLIVLGGLLALLLLFCAWQIIIIASSLNQTSFFFVFTFGACAFQFKLLG